MSPTAFGASGLFGGGERYPLELARALTAGGEVDCELVTFARTPGAWRDRGLARRMGDAAQARPSSGTPGAWADRCLALPHAGHVTGAW